MENIQFEITHERLVALIAKYIDVPAQQIALHVVTAPITADDTMMISVKAIVRTDLQTANKIDRRLKRLEGELANPEGESPAQE